MRCKIMVLAGLVALTLAGSGYGQGPDTLWTARFNWGESNNYGSSVLETGDGGFIVVGTTGNVDPYLCPDLCVIRTDSDGNSDWQETFGGDFVEAGRHVEQTRDGGYIVVGETESLGNGEMEFPDMYLIKLDQAGNQEWFQTYDGGDGDIGYWAEQTPDGGYIICGSIRVQGTEKLGLLKTDSLGNELWRRIYGDWIADGYSLRQTEDNGYIVAGCNYASGSYNAGYLLKVDSLGLELWSRHYLEDDALTIYCVSLTADGGYIMTGLTGDEHNFNIVLKKANSSGDTEWTRYFDIGTWDWGFWVEQTVNGGYILSGFVDSGDIFNSDAYILKTDAYGEAEWDLTLGGDQSDLARCIRQTSDGGFIACGRTIDTTGIPASYIWLIRIDAEGTPIEGPQLLTPGSFALYPAYPNPFNSSTTISYSLPKTSAVKIEIFDILGRRVGTLYEGEQTQGLHNVTWDASAQTSGTYLYRVFSNAVSKTGKLIIQK
jgi:hypothetical protein